MEFEDEVACRRSPTFRMPCASPAACVDDAAPFDGSTEGFDLAGQQHDGDVVLVDVWIVARPRLQCSSGHEVS